MRKKYWILFCIFFVTLKLTFGKAGNYNRNFVISGNQVWERTSDSLLKVFDVSSAKEIYKNLHFNFHVRFLTNDKYENVFICTTAGKLMRFDKINLSLKTVKLKYFDSNYGFAVNKSGDFFQVVGEGLLDNQSGIIYTPGEEYAFSEHRARGGAFKNWNKQKEALYFIDNRDDLWFKVSYGEWGDDQYIFNTVTHKFIKANDNLTQGEMFESNNSIFCRDSWVKYVPFVEYQTLSRVSFTSNTALKGQVVYSTLDNPDHEKFMAKQKKTELLGRLDDYMGPSAVNPADDHIYFICAFGLFKGNPDNSIKEISKWTSSKNFKYQAKDIKRKTRRYINPDTAKAHRLEKTFQFWIEEEYSSIIPEQVSKIAFTKNGILIFMSNDDGLGMFDGKKLTMLDKGKSHW